MEECDVYSYHTYMLPFVWNTKNTLSVDEYTDKLLKCGWIENAIKGFSDKKNVDNPDIDDIQKHKIIQYFTESARQSILGWNKDYVKCLSYDYDYFHNTKKYYIKKEKEYELDINDIKIKVYNTGIAVLIIETENKKYKTIEDVKNINEYGRRLFAPFFTGAALGCDIVADKLGITDFEICEISGFMPKSESDCIPGFIKKLLPNDVDIRIAIDDRMFVCCCVTDPQYSNIAKSFKNISKVNSGDLVYDETIKVAKSLYELIYIDKEGGCSCQSLDMLEKSLKESVYDRWEEYGTYTMVSPHSMVFLSNGGAPHAIESFLTQYVQMAATVLSQRAAIIAFDSQISDLSKDFEKPDTKLNRRKVKELSALQEKYIAFLTQHMNIEITCQEQGIELYKLLQKHLYILDENEKLKTEIDLLSDAAKTSHENYIGMLAIIVSIIFSIIILILEPVRDRLIGMGVLGRIFKVIATLFK